MVAERVGRPVRPLIHAQGPWGGPGAMSPDHGFDDSGVSPGRVTIKEEEYQRLVQAAALAGVSWGTPPIQPTPTAQPQDSGSSETIPDGSSDAPHRVVDESPSMPPISSASESGSPVTRRHLQISLNRTKRGFIQVSELSARSLSRPSRHWKRRSSAVCRRLRPSVNSSMIEWIC